MRASSGWQGQDARTLLASAVSHHRGDLNRERRGVKDGGIPMLCPAHPGRVEGVKVRFERAESPLKQSRPSSRRCSTASAPLPCHRGLSRANTIRAAVFERIRDSASSAPRRQRLAARARGPLRSLAVTLSAVGRRRPRRAPRLAVDGWAARTGQQPSCSPRVAGRALVFSVLLGGAAALYATLRIVRLSPAESIRRGA